MPRRRQVFRSVVIVPVVMGLSWGLVAEGQRPGEVRPPMASPRVTASRFEFEVIQSFDAKYLGDTPGHVGKNGGLEGIRPNVALGDAIYHGELKVGTVTGLTWDRGRGSLEVEFDPEPRTRIAVGEVVWLSLDGSALSEDAR